MILKRYGLYLSTALVIAGLALLYFGLRRPLLVMADGRAILIETSGPTTGLAMREGGFSLSAGDRLSPPSSAWLGNVPVIYYYPALPASVFRQQDSVLVVGRRAGSANDIRSEASREGDDLRRVAVVDLQHGGSAFGFDSELTPHRALTPFVDRLDVVVDDHQRPGARVHHLGRKREPTRLEIVRLVDEDGVVLLRRDMALVDRLHAAAS